MNKPFNRRQLNLALDMLAIRLQQNGAESLELVVCGGSALIRTGLIDRTTRDVDIVALSRAGQLISPSPLPALLEQSAREVAEDMDLPADWLNNAPSRDEGGLFQMGLPRGIGERWTTARYGSSLTVHFVSRFDQIHLKLYASVDCGGYHIEDLRALGPTEEELEAASRWSMTHDISPGFRALLKQLLREIGHASVADRI